MVGVFIAAAILIMIGTQILGSTSLDCEDLEGYNSSTPDNSTGWAKQCLDSQDSTEDGYALLTLILIVIAAVGILSVVRLLGGFSFVF